MKVMIVNIDKFKNFALEKIKIYHKNNGDEIFDEFPLLAHTMDKIYVSCIFDFNRYLVEEWEGHKNVVMGGTGINIKTKLPKEIETIKPRLNYGFTQRGCIRKCPFCVVHKKEKFEAVGDLLDLWDGKSKEIELYDNNILAMPEQFFKITQQAIDNKIKIDFNQGMDIRLLNIDFAKRMKETALKMERFAFDNILYKDKVLNGIELMKSVYGKNWRGFWYVYTDGNFDDVMERLNILKKNGQKAYLMRDIKCKKRSDMIKLAQWVNGIYGQFFLYDFDKYERKYK
jgi:hypothetical protein